jgi:hypothetical protein
MCPILRDAETFPNYKNKLKYYIGRLEPWGFSAFHGSSF